MGDREEEVKKLRIDEEVNNHDVARKSKAKERKSETLSNKDNRSKRKSKNTCLKLEVRHES